MFWNNYILTEENSTVQRIFFLIFWNEVSNIVSLLPLNFIVFPANKKFLYYYNRTIEIRKLTWYIMNRESSDSLFFQFPHNIFLLHKFQFRIKHWIYSTCPFSLLLPGAVLYSFLDFLDLHPFVDYLGVYDVSSLLDSGYPCWAWLL